MFGFLKEKLKNAVARFSKEVDKESKVEEAPQKEKEELPEKALEKAAHKKTEPQKQARKEKPEEEQKEKRKEQAKEQKKEPKKESPAEKAPKVSEKEEEHKGFFGRLKDTFTKKAPAAEEEPKEEEEAEEEKAEEKEESEEKEEKEEKTEEEPKEEEEGPERKKEQKKPEEKKQKSAQEHKEKETPKAEEKTAVAAKKHEERIKDHVHEEIKWKIPGKIKEKLKDEIQEKKHEERIIPKAAEKEELPHPVEEEKKPQAVSAAKVPGQKQKTGEAQEEKKSGFFQKIAQAVTETVTMKAISEEKFEELFWDLEVGMLENNVAVEVIEKIKNDLKEELVNKKVRIGKTEEAIIASLAKSIDGLFLVDNINLIEEAKKKKPLKIVFVGVNGSGKTTTIAKVASMLKRKNISCVIAAADTFRAAAIQQLEEHANRLGIKMIKHDYGSDPAAVAFDAVKYAEARNIDVVLIDTAGRLHSNTNLMDEMKKIVRVAKPDLKIFIGEAITGNDCVEQARHFNDSVGIDGIILAKADVDDKGGAAISVSYVTHKPILYLGTGQEYENLVEFSPKMVTQSLGLGA
jgi:fused signal recognition particle receptor